MHIFVLCVWLDFILFCFVFVLLRLLNLICGLLLDFIGDLNRAIMGKHMKSLRHLLQDKNLDLTVCDNEDRTPFGISLHVKDITIAGAICKRSPLAVEEVNSRGQTHLHLAISGADAERVKFLLDLGANVNTPVKVCTRRCLCVVVYYLFILLCAACWCYFSSLSCCCLHALSVFSHVFYC